MFNEPRGSSTKQSRSYVEDDANDEIYRDQATEAMVAEGCPNDDMVVWEHRHHSNDSFKQRR